jgi:hypothetical protein
MPQGGVAAGPDGATHAREPGRSGRRLNAPGIARRGFAARGRSLVRLGSQALHRLVEFRS